MRKLILCLFVVGWLVSIAAFNNQTAPVFSTSAYAGVPIPRAEGEGETAAVQAFSSVAIDISTATITQLVPGAGTTRAWLINALGLTFGTGATTNGSIQFVSGTVDDNSCATGRTVLTGPLSSATGAAPIFGAPVLVVPSSAALCAITTNTQAIRGWITFNR